MSDTELRPLAAGELLDHSFGLFRRLFVPLVVIQVVCSGLPFLLNVYAAARGGTRIGFTFLVYLIAFVLGALASAATAFLISESYLGRSLAPGEALRRAVPRMGAVMVLSLGMGLVVLLAAMPAMIAMIGGGVFAGLALQEGAGGAAGAGGAGAGFMLMLAGLALLVLPIFVFSGISVATPALVLEDVSAGRAMSRSWSLTKGFRLRIVGLLLVVLVVLMIPVMAIGGVGGLFSAEPSTGSVVLFTTLSGLVSLVIGPLLYCVITLLYYDLRVRKEAFDLEMLSAGLPA
jgi:hypothetical protein